jgi:hypothetical protein
MATIDNLRSTIGKRGGLARTNRFSVYMNPPTGGLLNLDLQGMVTNLIQGDANLASMFNDPRDIAILCKSCTLPGRQITTMDYQTSKQPIKVPYSFINEDVSFTFYLTDDYYIKKMFDKWMETVFDSNNYKVQYKENFTTDITIQQLGNNDIPVYSVVLENAYPISVSSVTLDNSSENTVQEVTVTMTYENFRHEGLLESTLSIAGQVFGQIGNTFGLNL